MNEESSSDGGDRHRELVENPLVFQYLGHTRRNISSVRFRRGHNECAVITWYNFAAWKKRLKGTFQINPKNVRFEVNKMVKLTPELIEQCAQYTNPVRDRELDLRGKKEVKNNVDC